MYKVRNGSFVENMTSMFNVADNKNYSLRCNNIDYSLDKPKTNFLKKVQVTRLVGYGMKCQIPWRKMVPH